MKKLTFLFALLCASVMGWATQYCEETITGLTAGETGGQTLTFTAAKTGTLETTFIVTSSTSTVTGIFEGVLQNNGGGTLASEWNNTAGWTLNGTTLTKVVTWTTYPTGNLQLYCVVRRDNSLGGSDIMGKVIENIDVSAACSSKPSPELSLNATTKTLEKDATAETFQIVANKEEGSGALSYSTSNNAIATVSNTGLVTAVGNGTATITVSVAENENFAADSKTLTVEVIDWSNIGWLTNSSDSYKLHISPDISDGFGGKRIDGSNLWVGFPSAAFGACSIDYTSLGAGVSFPLSNFTGAKSQFTMVCQGTTYTFTVYRKFDGVNLAKGMPASAGYNNANAWIANNGNRADRWGTEGAQHYAAVGDATQDWWYVDLGAVYSIETIKILFETACATDFDILTSPNGTSWVERGTYGEPTYKGNAADDPSLPFNEYTISPAQNARYVKIFTRNGYNNLQWGFSMWEFEVYGQPAENVDVNAPVLTSAAVSGTPTTTEIQIAVSATDAEDASITLFHVVEPTLGYNRNMTAVDGKLIFSGLVDNTEYNFTITALDNIGNQSNAIVVNASTAVDPLNPATMAQTPPSRSADDVRAIYSDAYAAILAHDFQIGGQWGAKEGERRVKSGNHYLLYDMSDNTNITWGLNDGGANAIVANDGYHAVGTSGLDASEMEYLHVDIWSQEALTNINVKIRDAVFTTITHDGLGWQSYDLPMEGSAVDFSNIGWIKLDGITSSVERHKIAVDNYYFWKAPSGVKAVNVSVNNGLWGSATAKVGDNEVSSVATDTEVTFIATPESGYDFAYWTIGETKVYENPYVLTITANTNAVATFEPSRTAYCSEPVTNAQGHTIYLTVKKTNNANEYMILFEGSSNTHITGSHGNIQFRLTHVNGSDGEHHFEGTEWTVDASGFGSIYTTFIATDFRAITITNRYIPLTTSNSAADEFNFPTNDATIIKWDATCTDEEAPVLAAPTATPLSGTSVRLAVSATDDMVALLTYNVNYKPEGDEGAGTNVEFNGTSGEVTYKNIKGLLAGVRYQFSVTASDGNNTSDAQLCYAKPTMPTAPVPTHNAGLVRSVYSNKYESALKHDFRKNTWTDIPYTEQSIGGDNFLVYTSDPAVQEQMPDVAWGVNNDGEEAIIAKDDFNDGTNKGLDVRSMAYIHFDIWSAIATNYPELRLNDELAGTFQLSGNGWQSFDLPLAGLNDAQKQNIRWIKFIGLRTPNPEEIAIDNVYFWSEGVQTTPDNGGETGGWATFSSSIKVSVPSGVTVYKAEYQKTSTEEILNLTDIGSIIPANAGVLIRGEANQVYAFSQTNDDAPDMTGNMLVGCPVRTDISSVAATNDIFCLRHSELFSMTGFFLYSGQYIAAGKAYLPLPKDGPAPAPNRKIRFVINENQVATGLENTQDCSISTQKVLENGQILIRRGDAVYTIQGVRVK